MLHGMTAAEASSHTKYLLEQEADEKLWSVWLSLDIKGEMSFDQFKAEQTAAARKTVTPTTVRALRPGEEADRLAFAAQFVNITNLPEE